jgi:outer membrane protein assembly factor BamB
VSIRAPAEGDLLDEENAAMVVLAASVEEPSGNVQVEFYLDEDLLATFDSAPFQVKVDINTLMDGGVYESGHTFRVEAKSPAELVSSNSVDFRVTKRVLWKFDLDAPILGSPKVVGPNVVVATGDGRIIALNKEGEIIWTFRAQNDLAAGISIGPKNSEIYFGDTSGLFYSLTSDGRLRWKITLGIESGVVSAEATVRYYSQVVMFFVPFFDGRIYLVTEGLNSDNPQMRQLLTRQAHLRLPVLAAERSSYNTLLVAAYDDGVIVGCEVSGYGSSLATDCQELDAGEEGFWTTPPVAAGNNSFYIGGRNGVLYLLSHNDLRAGTLSELEGSVIADFGTAITTKPVLAEDNSILIGTQDAVCRIDLSGEVLWKIFSDDITLAEPLIGEQKIYIAEVSGQLHAYSKDVQAMPAACDWEFALGEDGGYILNRPLLDRGVLYVNSMINEDASAGVLYAVNVY